MQHSSLKTSVILPSISIHHHSYLFIHLLRNIILLRIPLTLIAPTPLFVCLPERDEAEEDDELAVEEDVRAGRQLVEEHGEDVEEEDAELFLDHPEFADEEHVPEEDVPGASEEQREAERPEQHVVAEVVEGELGELPPAEVHEVARCESPASAARAPPLVLHLLLPLRGVDLLVLDEVVVLLLREGVGLLLRVRGGRQILAGIG